MVDVNTSKSPNLQRTDNLPTKTIGQMIKASLIPQVHVFACRFKTYAYTVRCCRMGFIIATTVHTFNFKGMHNIIIHIYMHQSVCVSYIYIYI